MTKSAEAVLGWDTIPSADQEPAGAYEPSGVLTALRNSPVGRRAALRSAAALGGALGLTALGWLPPMRQRHASAARGTEYTNCTIFSSQPGYTGLCWPDQYSRSFCGSDGWFKIQRNDPEVTMWPIEGCNGRNAWRWTQGSSRYRCADGKYQVRGQSPVFKICSWKL